MTHSRRSVLRRGAGLAVAGTAASLAGCSGTTNGGSGGFDAGYAAFFTLNDWANQVAGDHASFEDPVDVGQLGHGWTPDGNLAVDVASTDAFVYPRQLGVLVGAGSGRDAGGRLRHGRRDRRARRAGRGPP